MKPFHVGYVEAGYPHPHGGGGAGTYVRLMGRELVRRGVRVSVVASWCPQCPAHHSDEGIEVYRPSQRGNVHWYAGKVPGLRGLALSVRYMEAGWHWYRVLEDLHGREPFSVVEFAEGGDFWHGFRQSFPIITHLHGSRFTFLEQTSRPLNRFDRLHRRLELAFIRRARRVFSPTCRAAEVVRQEMNGTMPPVIVMPYPLEPALLGPGEGEMPASSGENPLVLYAARNDPVKGASVLLEAVPLVRCRVPRATFLLVGHEPSASERSLAGVNFLPFMPKEQLLSYYRQADLCVFPSYFETFGYTVSEAMAAGKAVVASRVGGVPELVADGETGVLVPPGDAPRLAEAISGLLLDHERRRAMGRAARQRIVQMADLEDNVRQRLAVYEQVAASRP